MNSSLREQLEQVYGKPKKKKRRRRVQKQTQEVLTDEDIKELMGVNRPTYRRGKGGSFRQR